ncbi:hypothetical protein [Stutzerimonas xanthomarina]
MILVGFGTFVQRHRGARTGKPANRATGNHQGQQYRRLQPGKMLKDAVN